MGGKTRENRFTLEFNLGDPVQKSAVDTLNALGHGKARYIATAIYYWQHSGVPPVLAPSSSEVTSEITSKIEETLEVLLTKKGIIPLPPAQHMAPPPKSPRYAKILKPDDDGDMEVPARFLNASMNAFKTHTP